MDSDPPKTNNSHVSVKLQKRESRFATTRNAVVTQPFRIILGFTSVSIIREKHEEIHDFQLISARIGLLSKIVYIVRVYWHRRSCGYKDARQQRKV